MIREFDKDGFRYCLFVLLVPGNGEIDFQEFLEVMASRVTQTSPEQVMREVFSVFDTGNSILRTVFTIYR